MSDQHGPNDGVPDLGALARAASQPIPRVGVNIIAIARELDDGGTFQAAGIHIGPDGQPALKIGRTSYLDADEFAELIARRVVAMLKEAADDSATSD